MNKIKSFFYTFCFISAVLFFFAAAFNKAYAESGLTLKGISVSESKKNNSYFIWFRFNGKPRNVLKNMIYKKYGIEAVFNNTASYASARQSKFVNFKGNRLFKAAEIIPAGNSGLDAVVYFNKNIKIARKDVFASFYRNYFVIKIVRGFPADIFKNVGKKNAVLVNSAAAEQKSKINKAKSKNSPKPSAALNAGVFSNAKHLNLKNSSLKNPAALNMGLEAVKTAVYLALIIGMIYGIYFFMNKFKNRVSTKEKINSLKIISSINLGNKKSILLIEVNKEFFLVGVSPSNIQMIGRLQGVKGLQNSEISDYAGQQGKTAVKEIKESKEIKGKSDKQFNPEAYAAYETHIFENTGSDDTGNALNAPFASSSPAVKTYGRFADVMREKIVGRSDRQENAAADAFDKSGKVKNINEAKFKNKADNIFFDIEERLKGLMESDVKSKKL